MKKSNKRKIKHNSVFVLLISVSLLFVLIFIILEKDRWKNVYMIEIVNRNVNDVDILLENYDLDISIIYEYSDIVEKDIVISQSIAENEIVNDGDKLNLVVSRGKLDKEQLKKDGINELGKVPIMMYHGIYDMKNNETNYIGGNVDKDGYSRTTEAFRNDLEMYYQKGYRMVKLSDYIKGNIDVGYGYSPIILTFDDGNANNIKVNGIDEKGNIIIDPNSAVGILEEFKKKYPDYNVTAIFFVTNNLFNQDEYDEKIINWLVDNGYEVGNHTQGHNNFTQIDTVKTQEVVGYMYNKLEDIIGDRYSKIVALPFGSPYNKTHANYQYILNGIYNDVVYETEAALRVGWEPETSPFDISFDKTFLKRCRAYDNNGVDFDIEMTLRLLEKTRYVSDGDIKTIVTSSDNSGIISTNIDKTMILY